MKNTLQIEFWRRQGLGTRDEVIIDERFAFLLD